MASGEGLIDGFGVWYEVEPNTGCWLWLRAALYAGYGTVQFQGKQHLAHRVMKQLAHGRDLPEGAVIMHKCDTPGCVNPSHLLIGTPKENQQDMVAKGRSMKGRACPTAKITAPMAREIRAMGGRQIDIAEKFGVSKQTVCDIKSNRTWRNA